MARNACANISLLPLPHRAALANSLALCDGGHSCTCASSATGSAQPHSPNGDCLQGQTHVLGVAEDMLRSSDRNHRLRVQIPPPPCRRQAKRKKHPHGVLFRFGLCDRFRWNTLQESSRKSTSNRYLCSFRTDRFRFAAPPCFVKALFARQQTPLLRSFPVEIP